MLKVLIADDNYLNRRVLAKMLERVAVCEGVVNGLEVLDALQASINEKRPYDLVLLDIMMPEMDGREALEKIRELERQNDIHTLDGVKVIMVTALSDAKTIMKAFRSGCEGYLVKPVTRESLFTEIENLGLSTGR